MNAVELSSVHMDHLEPSLPRRSRIPTARSVHWQPVNPGITIADPAVDVFMTRPAFWECCSHALSDPENEVGGWLLGKWRADPRNGQQFVVVDTILPARFTINSSSHLTFTSDSQVALRARHEAEYPDKEVIGWFHTHPRMSVFLSSYDIWLHRHFFPEAWQVALVIEPHSETGGFFIRTRSGELDPRRYAGFYELTAGIEQSVVGWHNLAPTT
jgi:proteasome lid subunit RPN8/RPN11